MRSDPACDTSIASSRRDKTIGTGLADKDRFCRDLWLPEIRKILDLGRGQLSNMRSDPACDTSIASYRRDKTIGTGLADKDRFCRDLWLPEIRKILDDQGRSQAAKPRGQSYGYSNPNPLPVYYCEIIIANAMLLKLAFFQFQFSSEELRIVSASFCKNNNV
ncbi:hypothetical protein DdX_09123 [Ditylenchus destructor]|uniref:Uncharacterized protein n=1 Tax=Ditylenchus destructor TaxID=166010 RepID=A0AAD4N766_9BILA|nr:hypothetical protein DdX_09123 [Ditylenchus destructor]